MRFAMTKTFDQYNKALVVLANPKTVVNDKYAPKEVKEKVIRGDQLISFLKTLKSDIKSSKKEMLSLGEKYLSLNIDERKEYIKRFQELADASSMNGIENVDQLTEATEKTKEVPISEHNINKEIGVEQVQALICPWCGRELVLRTAKKGNMIGKQFYGCSGFPKCRYVKCPVYQRIGRTA